MSDADESHIERFGWELWRKDWVKEPVVSDNLFHAGIYKQCNRHFGLDEINRDTRREEEKNLTMVFTDLEKAYDGRIQEWYYGDSEDDPT